MVGCAVIVECGTSCREEGEGVGNTMNRPSACSVIWRIVSSRYGGLNRYLNPRSYARQISGRCEGV